MLIPTCKLPYHRCWGRNKSVTAWGTIVSSPMQLTVCERSSSWVMKPWYFLCHPQNKQSLMWQLPSLLTGSFKNGRWYQKSSLTGRASCTMNLFLRVLQSIREEVIQRCPLMYEMQFHWSILKQDGSQRLGAPAWQYPSTSHTMRNFYHFIRILMFSWWTRLFSWRSSLRFSAG